MSISIMGSVASYTKTMKLQTQWDLKQQSGDYTSHKKSLSEWLDTNQQALQKSLTGGGVGNDEEANKKLNDILQKVYAGKKLTRKEKDYLKAKNPQMYEKLRAIEKEQKAYEQKLRQCKTKEEVQRLKMNQLASSMTVIDSVRNNPRIPLTKKLEICMQEKVRCDRMQESTQNFVKSGEYNRLPTEAEQAKAQKEEKEKLEAALKPKDEQTKPKPDDKKSEAATKTEQTPVQPNGESSQTKQTAPAPTAEAQDTSGVQTTTHTQSVTKPTVKVETASAKSSTSGDVSPELRKVRRAKRQAASAAYKAVSGGDYTPSQPALNVKA